MLESLRDRWNALAKTRIGDTIATIMVITLVSSTFVVAALFVIGMARGINLVFG